MFHMCTLPCWFNKDYQKEIFEISRIRLQWIYESFSILNLVQRHSKDTVQWWCIYNTIKQWNATKWIVNSNRRMFHTKEIRFEGVHALKLVFKIKFFNFSHTIGTIDAFACEQKSIWFQKNHSFHPHICFVTLWLRFLSRLKCLALSHVVHTSDRTFHFMNL